MMRRIVQLVGAVVPNAYFKAFAGIMLYQGSLKGFCIPILNCYACPLAVFSCPIGTVQHFVAIRALPLYTIGLLGLVGSTVGSFTCGWICPFGTLQELMYKIRSFKVKIPRPLRYLRYVSLILLVGVLPFLRGETSFCRLCPQGTLEAGVPLAVFSTQIRALVGTFFYIKLSILFGFLFLFVISKRPFCMTFCPLGAVFSLFNKFSLLRFKVTQNSCSECDLCVDPCPAGIVPYKEVDSADCIRCWECIKVCPKNVIQAEFVKFWKLKEGR
jgi:polyferredoxin